MRNSLLMSIGLVAACSAMPAKAQLLSERTEGLDRVCTYAGSANVTSEGAQRTHRIGVGQNCPLTYPALEQARFPLPPTAELREERLTEEGRECVYEQGGTRWPVGLPSSQPCPLFAGLIGSASAAGRGLAGSANSSSSDNLGARRRDEPQQSRTLRFR